MHACQHNAVGCGGLRLLHVLRPKRPGNAGVQADAKAHGHCQDQILKGIRQGNCRQGILADPCHIHAVYNIVKRLDHHGYHGRYGHGNEKREDLFRSHDIFCLFHILVSPLL